MKVLNLTPHEINIIKRDCTVEQRYGKILLRPEVSLEDALIDSFQPEPKPLNITPDGPDIPVNDIPYYSSITRAQDNYGLKFFLLSNNPRDVFYRGVSQQFKEADMVIVNQRCANYINAQIPFIPFNQNDLNGEIYRQHIFDKLYIPFDMVYPNRREDSVNKGFSGHKPIGALGLQKVTGYMDIVTYARAIREGLTVSLPGLCLAAFCYTRQLAYERRYEQELQVVNHYLIERGYSTYQ